MSLQYRSVIFPPAFAVVFTIVVDSHKMTYSTINLAIFGTM